MKRSIALIILTIMLSGCACSGGGGKPSPTPSGSPSPSPTTSAAPRSAAPAYHLPEQITLNENNDPLVEVYLTDLGVVETMDLESYLMGVVAGEMHNDWPLEALKAQAIIARTFALRFIADGGSKYEGAQVSTDVSEAQAYDVTSINERVRKAVEDTRGEIILSGGEPIIAWFHAHAGGVTAKAQEGLNYSLDEPPYTRSIQVRESDKAPEDVKSWTAEFSLSQVQEALDALGGGQAGQLAIGQRGESGRVVTFTAGSGEVGAVELRTALGSTKMKSTLLSDVTVADGVVSMTGSGYGHGVGMSQWGAYEMAAEGKTAEEIIDKFYQNIEIAQVYAQ
jgi:stage II sporulation protein D